jgi:hypothetical protein
MKKITLMAGLALILVLPAISVAKPSTDKASKHAARVACKSLRGHSAATREAFRTQYRSFAACVRAQRSDLQSKQEITDFKNAAKACDNERGDTAESRAAFATKYGTNPNKKNAFGKCVSQKSSDKSDDDSENEDEAETPPAS